MRENSTLMASPWFTWKAQKTRWTRTITPVRKRRAERETKMTRKKLKNGSLEKRDGTESGTLFLDLFECFPKGYSTIIPAATVLLVSSSIRMKLPVTRF